MLANFVKSMILCLYSVNVSGMWIIYLNYFLIDSIYFLPPGLRLPLILYHTIAVCAHRIHSDLHSINFILPMFFLLYISFLFVLTSNNNIVFVCICIPVFIQSYSCTNASLLCLRFSPGRQPRLSHTLKKKKKAKSCLLSYWLKVIHHHTPILDFQA